MQPVGQEWTYLTTTEMLTRLTESRRRIDVFGAFADSSPNARNRVWQDFGSNALSCKKMRPQVISLRLMERIHSSSKFIHQFEIVARRFVTALGTRDWNLLTSLVSEDAIWALPGTSQMSGHIRGARAVIERVRRIVHHGVTFVITQVLHGQQGLALALHDAARHAEGLHKDSLMTVCRVRAGKVFALHTYMSDLQMVKSVFV